MGAWSLSEQLNIILYTCVSDFCLLYTQVRHAFDIMGLVPEQVADVFMVLSGILHLGNVTFVSAAGAQIAEKPGDYHSLSLYLTHICT